MAVKHAAYHLAKPHSPPADWKHLTTWLHEPSGIVVCGEPVRISDANDLIVLYHYTCFSAFFAICSSKQVKSTLLATCSAERAKYDVCFYDGIYTTALSPDEFDSKEAVLVHNFTNTPDRQKQKQQIQWAQSEGRADFCIPIVASRSAVWDVMRDAIPGIAQGPGYNRHVEKLRSGRSIGVIRISREGEHAEESIGFIVNRLTHDDSSVRVAAVADLSQAISRGSFQCTGHLLRCFEDVDGNVREAAAFHMKHIIDVEQNNGLMENVLKSFRESKDHVLQDGVLEALHTLGRSRPAWAMAFQDKLMELLTNKMQLKTSGHDLLEALGAVAQSGDAAVITFIIAVLKQPGSYSRECLVAAISALSRVAQRGQHEALNILIELLGRSESMDVLTAAIEGVARLAQTSELVRTFVAVRECLIRMKGVDECDTTMAVLKAFGERASHIQNLPLQMWILMYSFSHLSSSSCSYKLWNSLNVNARQRPDRFPQSDKSSSHGIFVRDAAADAIAKFADCNCPRILEMIAWALQEDEAVHGTYRLCLKLCTLQKLAMQDESNLCGVWKYADGFFSISRWEGRYCLCHCGLFGIFDVLSSFEVELRHDGAVSRCIRVMSR